MIDGRGVFSFFSYAEIKAKLVRVREHHPEQEMRVSCLGNMRGFRTRDEKISGREGICNLLAGK